MIWPTDALQLAATKLRTRRIRLIITVVITSLIFATLSFLAFFAQGTLHSLTDFGKEGYGGRYLVQANILTYGPSGPQDKELMDYLNRVNKDQIAQKKAAAKKLGITYDEKTDQNLPIMNAGVPGGSTETYPNFGSPFFTQFYAKKNATIPGIDYDSFRHLAVGAGATQTYRGTNTDYGYSGPSGKSVTVLENGKEQFDDLKNSTQMGPEGPKGIQTITTIGWNSIDPALLTPFLLPGQTVAVDKDGAVPTIAPMSAAEEILGLKSLPATATTQQKLDRLVTVRKDIAGKTAQLCYRNSSSANLVSQAIQQQKDIEANKKNKDYVKPTLIYNIPADACAPVTIKSDTRSADEKKQADAQLAFDKQFGTYIEPAQGIVTVKIVGINPDVSYTTSISATAILQSLFASSLGGRWLSPNDAVVHNQIATAIQGNNVETASYSGTVYYAEFPSLKSMEAFIKSQTCDLTQVISTPTGTVVVNNGSDTVTPCIKAGKIFGVGPYGNSAGAIEQFRTGIWKVTRIVILVIVIMASLIMMGNIGKIIADSRRETAVFRALGAKRLDIAQIYLTYAVLLSGLVLIVAVAFGGIAAWVINARYSPELSLSAVLTYGAQDIHKQFSLFGVNLLYLGIIAGLVLLSGLISASLPLLTNTRRNPIRDMRDEN